MVLVNGFPKSGTHALWKACYLLGIPAEHGHFGHDAELPANVSRHLFIKRDPRNVIGSWLRERGLPLTQGSFVSAFADFGSGRSLADEMRHFEGWQREPDVLVVRYEDLIGSDAAMRSVAAHCGVPYLDDAFGNLPGATRTWQETHTDYCVIWTDEVARRWNDGGGNELLARWGYV